MRTVQFTPVTPDPSCPTAPIVPATCRPWAPRASGVKHVPVTSSEYDPGIVGLGSGPLLSAALVIVPPAQSGSESAALTKSYPSEVRFAAIPGWSKRIPSSTTATSTAALPPVMDHARGRSMRP